MFNSTSHSATYYNSTTNLDLIEAALITDYSYITPVLSVLLGSARFPAVCYPDVIVHRGATYWRSTPVTVFPLALALARATPPIPAAKVKVKAKVKARPKKTTKPAATPTP